MLLDISTAVLCFFAAFTQILCIRQEWADARCANFSTLLKLGGWFALSVRFSQLLIAEGDLPVSAASIVALICLALAEITAAALHQRK